MHFSRIRGKINGVTMIMDSKGLLIVMEATPTLMILVFIIHIMLFCRWPRGYSKKCLCFTLKINVMKKIIGVNGLIGIYLLEAMGDGWLIDATGRRLLGIPGRNILTKLNGLAQ
jgi:hypothetical protein